MKIESILENQAIQVSLAIAGVGLTLVGFYLLLHAAAAAAIAGALILLVAGASLAAVAAYSAWKGKSAKELATLINRYESDISPVGILNRGNTCFAAAYLQLLFGNQAFVALCKKLPFRHPVRELLDQYTRRQLGGQDAIQTERLRAFLEPTQSRITSLFKAVTSYFRKAPDAQEDPHELALQLGAVFAPFLMEREGRIVVNGVEEQVGINVYKQTSVGPVPDVDERDRLAYQFPILDFDNRTGVFEEPLQQYLLSHSPATLLFNIGRYTPELRIKPLLVPFLLTLPKKQIVNGQGHRYVLQGFLRHEGLAQNQGHYIAYQMHKGQFFRLNDSCVTPITQQEYLEEAKQAYLLNYTKV